MSSLFFIFFRLLYFSVKNVMGWTFKILFFIIIPKEIEMEILGKNIIGSNFSTEGKTQFFVFNPSNGEKLSPPFYEATAEDIERAMNLAHAAFETYRKKSPGEMGDFLDRIVDNILKIGDQLIGVAERETSLDKNRLQGEHKRMLNQISMFAQEARAGSFMDARIDLAQKSRKPVPKPDIRQMLVPLGPVVVFAASNFPLAFSVAGGDSISALAAKNPVIVKTHPNHPGTSELVANAIAEAVKQSKMPEGIFSMVHGKNYGIGLALVKHPLTRAVAFTGSLSGGRALFDAAVSRPEPIPVYAEMGSINPVFILPEAMKKRFESIADILGKAVTLGAGQFCTNPGLIVTVKDKTAENFIHKLVDVISKEPTGNMLYKEIFQSYESGIQQFLEISGVDLVGVSNISPDPFSNHPAAFVMKTSGETFLKNNQLAKEVFGPSTLIVQCKTEAELMSVAQNIEGQLTVTLHATSNDIKKFNGLIFTLERKAGRILWGGVPTGVEVCPSMFHGGPYPATTDGRSTSVGTLAMKRFLRPVCFQNFPQKHLPEEIKNKNSRGIWRLINNQLTKDSC